MDGIFPINNIKVQFFENLSGDPIGKTGEDFCFILTHDCLLDIVFSMNIDDFQMTSEVL